MSECNMRHEDMQDNIVDFCFKSIEDNCDNVRKGLLELKDFLHQVGEDQHDRNIDDLIFLMNPKLYPMTNRIVVKEFVKTNGDGFCLGLKKLNKDLLRGLPPALTKVEMYRLGENLATTMGNVIYQNDLMQVLHYQPTRKAFHSVPLLIIPPWINKYYIFDLTKEKSFVQYAIDNNIDVYVVSWKNPTEKDKETSLNCYIQKGIETAIQKIGKPVNLMGFCLGGVATLISGALHKAGLIKSITLLATPIDFSKMHEIQKFMKMKDIKTYTAKIKRKGYKCGKDLLRMFCLMKPEAMIVDNIVEQYYLGRDPKMNDFLYWNMDSTNLPATMHLEYVEKFIQKNLLFKGQLKIGNERIDLKKINFPLFIVATEKDHIVPMESAFAMWEFNPDARYVLTGSGHIAGIINPPLQKKYHYKVYDRNGRFLYEKKYSWWTEWLKWIKPISGNKISKIQDEVTLEPAPGRYALSQPALAPYHEGILVPHQEA
ncbi:MAG: Poly(3-hydroxyalkanoate) polymerase subunit PhaC [Holosporales bacterium]